MRGAYNFTVIDEGILEIIIFHVLLSLLSLLLLAFAFISFNKYKNEAIEGAR